MRLDDDDKAAYGKLPKLAQWPILESRTQMPYDPANGNKIAVSPLAPYAPRSQVYHLATKVTPHPHEQSGKEEIGLVFLGKQLHMGSYIARLTYELIHLTLRQEDLSNNAAFRCRIRCIFSQ